MWLVSCWGRAVNSVSELKEGVWMGAGEGGAGKELGGGRGRGKLDLTEPGSRSSSPGSGM